MRERKQAAPKSDFRILQNQDSFRNEEYRAHAVPLLAVLSERGYPDAVKRLRSNGFIAGLLLYLFAREFKIIVTVGHRAAMVYGLLGRLLGRRGRVHLAKEFFFEKSERPSLLKKISAGIMRFALRDVDAVVVNASAEARAYAGALGLPESRLRFIPWPTNIDRPEMIPDSDGSIVAAGRSLRDWPTLFSAAEGMGRRIIVIASRQDVAAARPPSSVELLCDIPYHQYIALLKKAELVVIPLYDTQRSTGQASFLEAMAFGKAVIVADVVGARDYIENGVSGLLYRPGDAAELRRKMEALLSDKELRERLSRSGYAMIVERFNKQRYVKEMLRLIRECRAKADQEALPRYTGEEIPVLSIPGPAEPVLGQKEAAHGGGVKPQEKDAA
ncbi:MAG: glycosyltransferase family 4 protein [Nitrospirota bacterium]